MATRGARSGGARVHRRGRSLNSRVLQLGALALSFTASMTKGSLTVSVTLALAQFDGLAISQIL